MKKWGHFVLFLIAFQVEVRVRASDSLSIPENCFGRLTPCSLKVPSSKWTYKEGPLRLHASQGSILTENIKTREWRLVEGTLWVENAPSLRVRTTSAEVEGSSGQYWIIVEQDRALFRNISAKLVVTFKDQSKMEIPRGFEVWVGAVNSEAQVERGMLKPIDLKRHLKVWHALYPGTRQQFISEVQDLKDQWSDLTEQSSAIYQKVSERKLASLEDEKQRELEIKKKKEQERRRLRENFHRRVFEF